MAAGNTLSGVNVVLVMAYSSLVSNPNGYYLYNDYLLNI